MNGGRRIWLWRLAGAASLLVALLSMSFARIPDINVCKSHEDPILAFELVARPSQAASLFPPDCRAAQLEAQRVGLRLDSFGFIPAYGLFLFLALYAQVGERSPRTVRAIKVLAAMVGVAMLADWWENSRLAILADTYPGTVELIGQLYPAVRVKFMLLGIVVTLIGVLHMRVGGYRRLAGAVIAVSGAWAAVATVVAPHGLAYPNSIAWGTLIALSLILAVRPPRPIGGD
jgi:hypothetical protein